MLCRRSASFTRMTRMSSTIARSILRKFSACRSSLDENGIAPSLVTPSTTCAMSLPNRSWIRSIGVCVSSTMSCSSPAATATTSSFMSASRSAAGCGKYSWSTLSAVKSFKDGNLLYAQKDWKRAAEKYEEVVARPDAIDKYPQLATAYFFLGNSYDQLYKPVKQGDATNDAYIQQA